MKHNGLLNHLSMIILLASLLLAACTPQTAVPPIAPTRTHTPVSAAEQPIPAPADPSLPEDANGEMVRLRMLNSHLYWQTAVLDVTLQQYDGGDQPVTTLHQQVWVDHPAARFRLVTGLDDIPRRIRISDGGYLLDRDLLTGAEEVTLLPEFARLPFTAPQITTDTIRPFPLSGQFDQPVGDALFPTALAQRGGGYTVVNFDAQTWAASGRSAFVLEWSPEPGVLVDRFWVDSVTGMVLRWQNYGKGGNGALTSDMIVDAIELDGALDPTLFTLDVNPADHTATEQPAVPLLQNTPGGPLAPLDPADGELYFNMVKPDGAVSLVRLPGSCLVGRGACPAPEMGTGQPNTDQYPVPLIWSPDRSRAALAHNGGVYIFTPGDGNWQLLAEFPLVYEQMAWSPDGNQLALIAQQEDVSDVLVAAMDGTITNLTGAQFHDAEPRHFWIAGWMKGGVVFGTGMKSTGNGIYLQQPAEPAATPLTGEAASTAAQALVSPDGDQLAVVVASANGETAVSVMDAGGAVLNQTVYSHASPALQGWSDDGQWLAYVVNQDGVGELFVANTDGSDPRPLFTSTNIVRADFSPDGTHLVVEADPGSGLHLFIVPVEGGEASLVSAPGLDLQSGWRGASWR